MAKNNNTNINTKTSAGDIEGDAFMTSMVNALQKSAGAISSYDSEIEKGISSAIKSTQQATEANTARVESAFEREKGYSIDTGNTQITTANEARRGFATNTGILKQIYQDTDKNLKDLEMRKQELILQGESAGASQIASLQLKALEMRQEAQQKAYTNLLSLASFGLSAKQEARQAKAQTFQEKSALAAIGLQYGIKVEPGDTIETMATKAAPFASQKQQLELAKMTQDIAESRARVNQILKEGNAKDSSPEDIKAIAQMYANGTLPPEMLPKFTDKGLAIFGKETFNSKIQNATLEASKYTDKKLFIEDAIAQNIPYDEAKKIADKYVKPKEQSTYWKDVMTGYGVINQEAKENIKNSNAPINSVTSLLDLFKK